MLACRGVWRHGYSMTFPDFMIVGGAKCGTTALHEWLRTHPEIHMPARELNFYSMLGQSEVATKAWEKSLIPNIESYSAELEKGVPIERDRPRAIGEKSVSYLYDEWVDDTIRNIRQLHPAWEGLKIIILLRDPVERTYSHYLATLADGLETLSFSSAIDAWQSRRERQLPAWFDYLGLSRYSKSVGAYLRNFRHVKILFFEQLRNEPASVVADLYRFLDVDSAWHPPNLGSNPNPARFPRSAAKGRLYSFARWNPLLRVIVRSLSHDRRHALLGRARRWAYKKPPLPPELHAKLRTHFIDDLRELQRLLKRPLPPTWLEPHGTIG